MGPFLGEQRLESKLGRGLGLALSVVFVVACGRAPEPLGRAKLSRGPAPPEPLPAPARASASSVPTEPTAEASEVARAPAQRRLRDETIDWTLNPVMRRLGRMSETMTLSEYSHGLWVNEREGVYKFDCSGMVYWLLKRAAPRAAAALAYRLEHRPLARDIYRRIASIEPDRPRHGWQRVVRVAELEPGDVVAWIKPAIVRSANTGHTGFVVLPPLRVPEYENAHLVRVADATSLLHDDDTRVGRDGFGMGTILLVSDPGTGEPKAYGWVGLRWRAFETDIALGRAIE